MLWLEPWAEEFEIPPGGALELRIECDSAKAAEGVFEWTASHLVYFAPGGSLVRVIVNGKDVSCGSCEIRVPDAGDLETRDFMQIAFGSFPEARPSGAPIESAVIDALGEPMARDEVRLELLTEGHRAALKAACAEDGETWLIYARSFGPGHFDESFDGLLARRTGCAFAVFVGERLVGMSSFVWSDAARAALEIGTTYYIPEMRGTGLNRKVKDLMIGRAIDCGFRRIEFRVDSRNGRSQAAMAKIGAVREGVIRAEQVTWTGHVRDTVLFSILAPEWKEGGARA